jgi:hypothetical protein
MLMYFEISVISLLSIILIFKIIKQVIYIGKIKHERNGNKNRIKGSK